MKKAKKITVTTYWQANSLYMLAARALRACLGTPLREMTGTNHQMSNVDQQRHRR